MEIKHSLHSTTTILAYMRNNTRRQQRQVDTSVVHKFHPLSAPLNCTYTHKHTHSNTRYTNKRINILAQYVNFQLICTSIISYVFVPLLNNVFRNSINFTINLNKFTNLCEIIIFEYERKYTYFFIFL